MGILEALQALCDRRDLSEAEMSAAVVDIMAGRATPSQIGGLLVGMRVKGETVDEIVGAARGLRAQGVRLRTRTGVILDTCGTGGDGLGTFNISTAAALVAASAGVVVAKHGNRAMSGRVGGADVLEALGVKIDLAVEKVDACLDAVGIAFLFAQTFHPAMKTAALARRELGVRTFFNLLGPLSNPAGATHQLVGVFSEVWLEPLAVALGRLGARRALVVHGLDGADEISLSGPTAVAELADGAVRRYEIEPEQFGLTRARAEELACADAKNSAQMIRALLAGEPGPRADVVALNAGAALYAAEAAPSLDAGIAQAREILRLGRAQQTLLALVEFSQR